MAAWPPVTAANYRTYEHLLDVLHSDPGDRDSIFRYSERAGISPPMIYQLMANPEELISVIEPELARYRDRPASPAAATTYSFQPSGGSLDILVEREGSLAPTPDDLHLKYVYQTHTFSPQDLQDFLDRYNLVLFYWESWVPVRVAQLTAAALQPHYYARRLSEVVKLKVRLAPIQNSGLVSKFLEGHTSSTREELEAVQKDIVRDLLPVFFGATRYQRVTDQLVTVTYLETLYALSIAKGSIVKLDSPEPVIRNFARAYLRDFYPILGTASPRPPFPEWQPWAEFIRK